MRFYLYADRVLESIRISESTDYSQPVKVAAISLLLCKGATSKNVVKAEEKAIHLINQKSGSKKCAGPQTVSFFQDWKYIKPSFYQAYHINIEKKIHSMTWEKFVEFFSSLPDSTSISKIVSIRSAEIPPPTKANAMERQRILKLKSMYSISGVSYQENEKEGLKKVAQALAVKAKRGGVNAGHW